MARRVSWTTRPVAGIAGKRAAPRTAKRSIRRATRASSGRARSASGTTPPTNPFPLPQLGLDGALKIFGIGASIFAFIAGYGAMRSDVKHQGEELTAMRVQVDRVYDRLLWNERADKGESGPAPPGK